MAYNMGKHKSQEKFFGHRFRGLTGFLGSQFPAVPASGAAVPASGRDETEKGQSAFSGEEPTPKRS